MASAPWGLVWLFSLQKTHVRVAPLHHSVVIRELRCCLCRSWAGGGGGNRTWKFNSPTPLFPSLYIVGGVFSLFWVYAGVCLCKCSPCSLLSSSLSCFPCSLVKMPSLLQSPFQALFLPCSFSQPDVVLLPLNPTVVYTFLMTSSSPGFLSRNAHSEMMGPNSLWESLPQGPVRSPEPSRHLVNIIQIEIDFLYDSLSATAGYLFPKEDLGQESSNRMSKICHMETINKWSETSTRTFLIKMPL